MTPQQEIKKLKKKLTEMEKRLARIEKVIEDIDIMRLILSEDEEEELYHLLRRSRHN